MKIFELFNDKGFHTTIITTFGVDFTAYENIALSRLRGAGCRNNILIVDRHMLTHALDGGSSKPEFAGKLYSVIGASAIGVFHPKIILQFGRDKARLILGSANTTTAGMAGNLELATVLECSDLESAEQFIVFATWAHVLNSMGHIPKAVNKQIEWLSAKTGWLKWIDNTEQLVTLKDGSTAALLSSKSNFGIGNAFVELINGDLVDSLLVISPYWDDELEALRHIAATLKPSKLILLIDKDKRLFPREAISKLEGVKLLDIGPFAKKRFVHAKLIIAQTERADHVLFGSANCTAAALGLGKKEGINNEACIYRRFQPGFTTESLELKKLIDNSVEIPIAELPEQFKDEDLARDELKNRYPGSFECRFNSLIWTRPKNVSPESVRIEILDSSGTLADINLQAPIKSDSRESHFFLDKSEKSPALAVLVSANGERSAPAVITFYAALEDEKREIRTKEIEKIALKLSSETEEGYWLWEQFCLLENLDQEWQFRKQHMPVSSTKKIRNGIEQETEPVILKYSAFIAGRQNRSHHIDSTQNTILGTEASLIRDFINRLLKIGAQEKSQDLQKLSDEENELFDRGDETADTDNAIESGKIFSKMDKDEKTKEAEELKATKLKKYDDIQKTRKQIETACNKTQNSMSPQSGISGFELLKLRTLLTVLAASGFPGSVRNVFYGDSKDNLTSSQVIPFDHTSNDWALLVGKLLNSFFGKPAIFSDSLAIENIYDQVPDDFIEFWVSCIWATCVCLLSKKNTEFFEVRLLKLLQNIFGLSGFDKPELSGDVVLTIMKAMNDRFSHRLGFSVVEFWVVYDSQLKNFKE